MRERWMDGYGYNVYKFSYFRSDCAEKAPNKDAQDKEVAKKLWILSEELVGLNK